MAKVNLNDYVNRPYIRAFVPEHLDAIQNGEAEFHDEEEED